MSESEMNLVVLGGRLVSEPELRELPANGRPVCFMRLCGDVPRTVGVARDDRPEYLDVIVLGAKARLLARRLHPGRCVILRGSLQMESREDGEGPEREAICVLAKRLYFG